MTRQFTAIIKREDDGYVALCPELDIASVVTLSLGTRVVMVGLVQTIHPTARSGVGGGLDPRDKPEDDSGDDLLEPEH